MKQQTANLMITLPKNIRDLLRTIAARENLKDPSRVTSAAAIAKEIIMENLDKGKCNNKEHTERRNSYEHD